MFWARQGQKVESIMKWPNFPKSPDNQPVKGGIYTIRDVCWFYDGCYLRLNEIHNVAWDDETYGLTEPGFMVSGFRPVVERKTDISIFERMLHPEPVS